MPKFQYRTWRDKSIIQVSKIKNYQEGREIYGHIYLTVFPNGKLYVGQCIQPINSYKENGYFGSGVLFDKAKTKYGKYTLVKKFLRLCYNREEYDKWEANYIKIFKTCDLNIGYNILPGTSNFKYGVNPSTLPHIAAKISKALQGRKLPKEVCEKMSRSRKGIPMTLSDDELMRRSVSMLGNQLTKGFKKSEYSRKLTKEKRKYQSPPVEIGSKCYNNGIKTIVVKKSDKPPEGFIFKGRPKKLK